MLVNYNEHGQAYIDAPKTKYGVCVSIIMAYRLPYNVLDLYSWSNSDLENSVIINEKRENFII